MKNKLQIKFSLNTLVKIAILSATAYVLMLIEFPLPIFPPFLKLDISEIPVLLAAFALGPVSAIFVELIKNALHLFNSTSMGVGEIANFVVGISLAVPAGIIYKLHKGKKFAAIGLLTGIIIMAGVAACANYFVMLPFYAKLFDLPMDAIVGMGNAVNGKIVDVKTLLLFGIVPFNLIKGVLVSIIMLLIYKPLSPILHKEMFIKK